MTDRPTDGPARGNILGRRLSQRSLDLVVATGLLMITAPLLVVVAILIKLNSDGPALYRARRTGRHGRAFVMYKFRTMVISDTSMPRQLLTTDADSRVTNVGRWLRRTKVDELPQLINVVRGEMSLVGPRPEDPEYVAQYPPEYRSILTVTPGVTSRASLAFANEEKLLAGPGFEEIYLRDILPKKLSTELTYEKERTIATDCHVMLSTAAQVLRMIRA